MRHNFTLKKEREQEEGNQFKDKDNEGQQGPLSFQQFLFGKNQPKRKAMSNTKKTTQRTLYLFAKNYGEFISLYNECIGFGSDDELSELEAAMDQLSSAFDLFFIDGDEFIQINIAHHLVTLKKAINLFSSSLPLLTEFIDDAEIPSDLQQQADELLEVMNELPLKIEEKVCPFMSAPLRYY